MSSFLEDIEFASKVNEAIKETEKRGIEKSLELTKEMIKQQYGDIKKYYQALLDIKEYLTSYESIHTIQFNNENDSDNDLEVNKDFDKKTMSEMTNRYLKVHDKLLNIIDKALGDKE